MSLALHVPCRRRCFRRPSVVRGKTPSAGRKLLHLLLRLVVGELGHDHFGNPPRCRADDLRAVALHALPDVLAQHALAFFREAIVDFSQQIVGKPAAASELVSIPAYSATQMADHDAGAGERAAIVDPDRGRSAVKATGCSEDVFVDIDKRNRSLERRDGATRSAAVIFFVLVSQLVRLLDDLLTLATDVDLAAAFEHSW